MTKKYPGYNENDTHWDDYHRANGEMTNREFFTSNGPGGFYEGMVWDEEKEEWFLSPENQRKRDIVEREAKSEWYCFRCEAHKSFCECRPSCSSDDDE